MGAEGDVGPPPNRYITSVSPSFAGWALRPEIGGVGKLPSVLNCTLSGARLIITVPREGDFRKAISEYLIRQDLVPLSIQEKMVSLEEAFVTITQETVGSLVGGGGQG